MDEILGEHKGPSYPTLYRRINSFDAEKHQDGVTIKSKDPLMFMAMDGSDLKQANRVEWLRVK